MLLADLVADRGSAITLSTLHVCPRSLYGRRTYEEIDVIHPLPIRRPFGPAWLVGLCDADGSQVILLAVSSYNTDVTIVQGKIRLGASPTGGEFKSIGVPNRLSALPMSPEAAVRLAYELTGVRVAGVPELHLPPSPAPHYEARWRIVPEKPVAFDLADGARVDSPEIWVGFGGSFSPAVGIGGAPIPQVIVNYRLRAPNGDVVLDTTFTINARAARRMWTSVTRAR